MMKHHHQQNDSNYHSEATITPTVCSIAVSLCPDFEHEISTDNSNNKCASPPPMEQPPTPHSPTPPPESQPPPLSHQPEELQLQRQPLDDQVVPPELNNLGLFTPVDELDQKYEIPYYNTHSDTLTYSATSMIEPFTIPDTHYYYFPPQHQDHHLQHHPHEHQQTNRNGFSGEHSCISSNDLPGMNDSFSSITNSPEFHIKLESQHSIFENDYNVTLALSKDMSIPHFSYPQDESQLFTTMAECFPMQTNVEDIQSYVNGLSSPDLSQHSKFSPHSTFSPLSPLSPLDEQNSLFDFDTKLFSHDMPPQLDSRDFFASDSFVNNKSFDETLFLRKFAGAPIKHENETHVYRRNKSSQQHAPYPTPSPTNSDISQRLHIETALAPPPAKPSRRTTKSAAPFACPHEHCPKTFTRQYNLKSHLRTHTDERPFVCNYPGCPRAFARQHDLKRHQKLHLGLKPHVCTNCGRAFARLDALNRHLRSDNAAQCAQATLAGAMGIGGMFADFYTISNFADMTHE
ncbi:5554_t:CDS:2 [Ambispora leptoticha]|uniref:5554_t:CDS:1 n=1 Tax=Ambispora leptoticha TaxID=144679 RepID=A0A9N8WQA6_9GLOM|nr:5554_t:CDS:2 [Ambispora leptoticha]